MKFEKLSQHHAKQLLAFELENKLWFESFIEPREESLYSNKGIFHHIDSLTKKMSTGSGFSGVLRQNNEIIGRANLKDIANNKAYVGYRVSKDYVSRGIASYCLLQLIDISKNKFNINHLHALVLENNPASMRVLQKAGFKVIETKNNFSTLNNKPLSCTVFSLNFV